MTLQPPPETRIGDPEPGIIYVVDDEPAVPEFVGRLLLMDDKSYQVECFDSAASVLERMAAREPGVLVTDIWMPGIDGIALLKTCRDKHPEVEVILVTAHASKNTAIAAIQHEAFAYIEKPFLPDQLKLAVRRALAKRRMLRVARAMLESDSARSTTRETSGAGSFFAAAFEYLPGEALVLDTSLRIVSANRAARALFNLGRRIKPRVVDVPPLEPLAVLLTTAELPLPPGAGKTLQVDGRTVRATWAEFLDGVRFCLVLFGDSP